MKLRNIWLIITLISLQSVVFAQKTKKELKIRKVKDVIKLDGTLTDTDWLSAATTDFFQQVRPYDTSAANVQTRIKVCFDDKFLYVGAYVIQAKNAYTISSLKRDFEGGSSDVLSINLDAFRDNVNGLQFALSPLNVQREGIISNGDQNDNSWDNKWYSAVKNFEDHWEAEIAIPFTTLRYKVSDGQNVWGINFGRNFMKGNEISTWNPVPRNFRPSNLAFTGDLVWEDAPPKPGANISIIPYISTSSFSDFPRDENLKALDKVNDSSFGVGFDAKVAVTPSLNLDLTVNPDFSQVEVDAQQTNLSRFELFFPEKRQFFIENSDLFGTMGFPNSRPFFSRRIGLARNPISGLNQQVPILAGARLSGKLNDNWRIGFLNMQTRAVDFDSETRLPAANYGQAVVQRKMFARSFLSGFIVNKENFLSDKEALTNPNTFNRVAGLEFNLFSKDNLWEGESYIHQSLNPVKLNDATSAAQFIGFHHPNIDLNLGVQRIGQNFKADMGFVPRRGVYNVFREGGLIYYVKDKDFSKKINQISLVTDGNDVFNLSGTRLDSETALGISFQAPNDGEYSFGRYWGFTRLVEPFDPTNASDNPDPDFSRNVVPIPAGAYKYGAFWLEIQTPRRYNFYTEFSGYSGTYFNGKTTSLNPSFSYRIQPFGVVSVDMEYNKITLPKPHNSVRYFLIGPKTEFAINRKVFWSTFFQYNTQANNTNINSRLQWRFKPVSDIFLVYTDNYFGEEISKYRIQPWTPKNRSLVFKLTYWFNV